MESLREKNKLMVCLNKLKNTECEQLRRTSVTDDIRLRNVKKSKDGRRKQNIKIRMKVAIRNLHGGFAEIQKTDYDS